jgi:hypothetical protein
VSLGKPTSIFSSSGGSSSSQHDCVEDEQQEEQQQQQHGEAESAPVQEGMSYKKKQWGTKLSKQPPTPGVSLGNLKSNSVRYCFSERPPTPGVSLGKPISIFSSSGISAALQQGDAASDEAEVDDEGGQHLVHFASAHTAGHQQVKQPAKKQQKEQQAPPVSKSKQAIVQQQQQQQWHSKLSKRPPTPGVSLGRPVSIFSDPGTNSTSSLSADADDADDDEDMPGLQLHLVHFQDQPQVAAGSSEADDEDAQGSSHHLVHFQEDAASTVQAVTRSTPQQVHPHSQRGACSTKKQSSAGGMPVKQHQHQQQEQQQHWNHKLSKRPPMPGAGLGQPVSIFTDDGSRPASASKAASSSSSKSSNVRPASASGCYAGTAASRGPCSSASSSSAAGYEGDDDDESCTHVHFKEPRPRVTFKQALLHFSDSPTPPPGSKQPNQHLPKQQQQQQQQAQVGRQQTNAHEQSKQQWVQKLSKRPGTPGGALGKPISIFSSDGSKQTAAEEAAAAVRRVSASSSYDEQQEALLAAVKFADHSGGQAHAGTGAAAAPAATKQACKKKQVDPVLEPADVEDSGSQQQWHHKLSKRPPTPGVSLGKPISIFSSSGSLEGQHHHSVASTPGPVTPAKTSGHQQQEQQSCSGRLEGKRGPSVLVAALAGHNTDLVVELQESAAAGVAQAEDVGDDGGHSISSSGGVAAGKNWASKLSKRPPTPGVGEGNLVPWCLLVQHWQ